MKNKEAKAKILEENGVKVNYDAKSKNLTTELSGQASFKLFREGEKVLEHGQMLECYADHDSHWRGGTKKDILNSENGEFNIRPFLDQKEKLQKAVGSQLEFLEAELLRKRTRFLSEHDGELDFDRLYERAPFYSTKFTNNGVARIMDINIDFTFSAGVDEKAITEYGTMAWAITDILEKAGIRCNIFVNTLCTGQSHGDLPINDYATKIKIKSTEEYIDTLDIARHFTSNYYRRVIFTTWGMANEALGREVAYGFGSVKNWDRKSSAEKGVLNLAISQMKDFKLDSKKLIEYIKKAV